MDRKIRVLVEDEEIHRVVARASGDKGGQFRRPGRGRERRGGGGACAGGGSPYDLILTDKQMSVMDGHEATTQIRSMGVTTPIVAVSSDSLPSDVEAFIKAGADDFTPKPLSKEKMATSLPNLGLLSDL